ncbi:hypothetical protein GGD81_002484 [Rhodobium orientis]|uniref:Uncharacterized protein n=1 Tax=Rhodobium orientis TaxID=34017 RepID=A0A327JF32_9HYPH|nr:putative glycolipid-binding domain-containing protein [Rhodobium orientis]MBB4303441.1 hypothetical protein [Rhodobium orientis]MBK5950375.1 hypothetical protein [Rhodobium orientis]RAI25017.1 hypothetical protein CH339_19965 [Rhodobium orientis]
MVDRIVRWRSLHAPGMEHLHIWQDAETVHCESVVIGERDGTRFGFAYRLVMDGAWRPRLAEVHRTGPAPTLVLQSDAHGRWNDGQGLPVNGIDGCLDVDIAATPFTNALVIRRLGLAEGESADVSVAYLRADDFDVVPVAQRYTCLEPGRRYRYEGGVRNVDTVLELDADGLVALYPDRFEQI